MVRSLFAAGGALTAGLFGLFIYLFLRKSGSFDGRLDPDIGAPSKKPVKIVKDEDGNAISVFINDKRFKISEDSSMSEL